MTETLCERCGQPVEVTVKERYRMHPLASYKCGKCGYTKVWQEQLKFSMRQGNDTV